MVPSETDGGRKRGLSLCVRALSASVRASLPSGQVKAAIPQVDDRSWNREKRSSFEVLSTPFANTSEYFLVFGDGARQGFYWHLLKSFDLLPLEVGKSQRVHVIFTDGRSQDFDLLGDELDGQGEHLLPMDYLRHVEVQSQPKLAPPPASAARPAD